MVIERTYSRPCAGYMLLKNSMIKMVCLTH